MNCSGTHLIADLYGCRHLDDVTLVEAALRDAVKAVGARLLDIKLHHFGPEQGVTGVALLAESHISIHTWPEHGYAAIDIFVCGGGVEVQRGIDLIADRLDADERKEQRIERGMNPVLR